MTYCNDPNETGNPNELPCFVETYKYDPFGAVTIYDPNGIFLTDSAIGNPYMFTCRRYDSESGLYYYRYRMYSPQLGRFMQTGPIGYYDSMNLYQCCINNPINYIDPLGLYTREEVDRFRKPVLTEQDLADAADMYYRQRLSQSREQDGWLNADSPYRYIKQKYSYNGKKYDDSSVNYIAIGMKAARDGRTLGQMYLFMIGWKLCKPDPHLPCWGDYYFANWGYDYYYDNYSDGNAPVTPSMPHIPYVPY
ncbi:MAG: RHS repeat-associated core domain-containing protein [Sedimentisphaeraceae bacterium JB056]